MKKTAAEYQQAYRERQRERELAELDGADGLLKKPFFQFLAEHEGEEIGQWWFNLEWAGIPESAIPRFEDDTDHDRRPEEGEIDRGSIGRAERIVGNFLDASRILAKAIHAYKREQITDVIAQIESSDLTDPGKRKEGLARIVKLTKLRDRLDKETRETFPKWRWHQ